MEHDPEFEIIPDTPEESAKWAKFKSELPKREPWEVGKPITYTYDSQGRLLGIKRP